MGFWLGPRDKRPKPYLFTVSVFSFLRAFSVAPGVGAHFGQATVSHIYDTVSLLGLGFCGSCLWFN